MNFFFLWITPIHQISNYFWYSNPNYSKNYSTESRILGANIVGQTPTSSVIWIEKVKMKKTPTKNVLAFLKLRSMRGQRGGYKVLEMEGQILRAQRLGYLDEGKLRKDMWILWWVEVIIGVKILQITFFHRNHISCHFLSIHSGFFFQKFDYPSAVILSLLLFRQP